jgi:Ca2+-binding EF-hand superfamily protein/MFS family permease
MPSFVAPSAELEELLQTTSFTKTEISHFYKYSGGTTVDRDNFNWICQQCKLEHDILQTRLWNIFDKDGDGSVTTKELIRALNPLTRGTLRELAAFFFELYDVDHSDALTAHELVSVYSDLVVAHLGGEEINDKQKDNVRKFFTQRMDKDGNGEISKAEFIRIAENYAKNEQGQGRRPPFFTCRNMGLVFVTSLFEIGTSFCLPAMGALAVRIQIRYGGLTDAGVGSLVGYYYAGSIFGPLFGGQCMDKIGPSLTIIIANAIVTFGSFLQATTEGSGGFYMLTVGRFIIGFGGLITPFCTIEVLARLFPDDFMFMAGFRNLIQSASGFGAFVILPAIANMYGGYEELTGADGVTRMNVTDADAYNNGTGMALWFCFFLGLLSLAANVFVYFTEFACGAEKRKQSQPTNISLGLQLQRFAEGSVPVVPGCGEKWKLPLSFYLSLYGIQATYFAPFAFTAFSNKIYQVSVLLIDISGECAINRYIR